MTELQGFQKLVIANAFHVKGIKVGAKAPDFTLPNAMVQPVTLSECLKNGPVVIKFYRGEWCPICNLDLVEVQKNIKQFEALGTKVIAISPQKPDDALTITQRNELGFEVLSDIDQHVICAYNLQFDPGEDYHQRRDLTLLNGDGSKTIPVPATFVIDTDSTIVAAHIEANYTERMSTTEILEVLKALKR